MRRGASFAAVVVAFLVARDASAQSTPSSAEKIALGEWLMSPMAEVRLRGEYRRDPPDLGGVGFDGAVTGLVEDSWNVAERSRLGLGVERGALRAQVTVQDAHVLGVPYPSGSIASSGSVGSLRPYEAYLEIRGSGARPAYVRLGRQAVVLGEGRLVGSADFSPTGRTLDAARAHVAVGNFDFEALASILEPPSPLGSAFDDRAGFTFSGIQLHGLTGRWSIDPLLKIELLALAKIARSGVAVAPSRFAIASAGADRYTGSLRVFGDSRGWSYSAEGAYQLGRAAVPFTPVDVAAWAVAAHVDKVLPEVALTPKLRVAVSYASGDDGGGGKYKQFDPILEDPQRFHGMTDLFAWSNVEDIAVRAEIVPLADTTLAAEYRYARLADERGEWVGAYGVVGSPFGPAGPAAPAIAGSVALGHEADLVFAWHPWAPLDLRVGWSGLFLGDGARGIMAAHLRGNRAADGSFSTAKIAQYAYMQAELSFP